MNNKRQARNFASSPIVIIRKRKQQNSKENDFLTEKREIRLQTLLHSFLLNIIFDFLPAVPYFNIVGRVCRQWFYAVKTNWAQLRTLNFSDFIYNYSEEYEEYRSERRAVFEERDKATYQRLKQKDKLTFHKTALESGAVAAQYTSNLLWIHFVQCFIQETLKRIAYHSQVRSLEFTNSTEEDTLATSSSSTITTVSPSSSPSSSSTSLLSQNLSFSLTCPNIEKLVFSDVTINAEIIALIQRLCPNLKAITFCFCKIENIQQVMNISLPATETSSAAEKDIEITFISCDVSYTQQHNFNISTNNSWTAFLLDLIHLNYNPTNQIAGTPSRRQRLTQTAQQGSNSAGMRNLVSPRSKVKQFTILFTDFEPDLVKEELEQQENLAKFNKTSKDSRVMQFAEYTISPGIAASLDKIKFEHENTRNKLIICYSRSKMSFKETTSMSLSEATLLNVLKKFNINANTPTIANRCSKDVHMEFIKKCITLGLSVNLTLPDGNTILHYLLIKLQQNIKKESSKVKEDIKFLLENGANKNMKNANDESCISLAKKMDDDNKLFQFLEASQLSKADLANGNEVSGTTFILTPNGIFKVVKGKRDVITPLFPFSSSTVTSSAVATPAATLPSSSSIETNYIVKNEQDITSSTAVEKLERRRRFTTVDLQYRGEYFWDAMFNSKRSKTTPPNNVNNAQIPSAETLLKQTGPSTTTKSQSKSQSFQIRRNKKTL